LILESFMSIYVGNLSYDVTQDDLNAVFAEYGTVKRVQLPLDRETGRPRGFGFVEMSTEAEETAAIEALDGAEWMGRDLRVNKAKPREERSGSGGGGGGRGRDDRNRFSNSWGNSGGSSGGGGGGYSRY
jgi:RNA recognition motif-containing protein